VTTNKQNKTADPLILLLTMITHLGLAVKYYFTLASDWFHQRKPGNEILFCAVFSRVLEETLDSFRLT